ncbi:hypothetical protein TNCV_4707271 [Trichonephila clavipes]|nr:hypothetical protein TNCV_4707271 [Trichonephila clavipes]
MGLSEGYQNCIPLVLSKKLWGTCESVIKSMSVWNSGKSAIVRLNNDVPRRTVRLLLTTTAAISFVVEALNRLSYSPRGTRSGCITTL